MAAVDTICDASFLIDLLHRDPGAEDVATEILSSGDVVSIPAAVHFEVLSGIAFAASRAEAMAFESLVEHLPSAPFDDVAAEMAAHMLAESMRRGERLSDLDAMIVGTARRYRGRLLSRDRKMLSFASQMGILTREY